MELFVCGRRRNALMCILSQEVEEEEWKNEENFAFDEQRKIKVQVSTISICKYANEGIDKHIYASQKREEDSLDEENAPWEDEMATEVSTFIACEMGNMELKKKNLGRW